MYFDDVNNMDQVTGHTDCKMNYMQIQRMKVSSAIFLDVPFLFVS